MTEFDEALWQVLGDLYDAQSRTSTGTDAGTSRAAQIRNARKDIEALIKQRELETMLNESKLIDRRIGQKFDELCARISIDPFLGNSLKGKKDNFLDGAESMILIASTRRNEIEAELNQLKQGNK